MTQTQIPTLQTERLILRGPVIDDFPIYRDFFADAVGSGNYGGPKRPDDAFRTLAYDIGHWHLKGFGKWIMQRRDDGVVIGGCGLVQPNGWPRHELTWWLLKEHRGAGYATEASHAAIEFGYNVLEWPVVETHMRDENLAARAIAERLGGKIVLRETFPDGVTRDIFALPVKNSQAAT